MSKSIDILYSSPFPSTRTGALFNAFSYPTKISPEAEAIFIACHSNIGDTIFDPFGGSVPQEFPKHYFKFGSFAFVCSHIFMALFLCQMVH
mgnify:CR=1 FL=1